MKGPVFMCSSENSNLISAFDMQTGRKPGGVFWLGCALTLVCVSGECRLVLRVSSHTVSIGSVVGMQRKVSRPVEALLRVDSNTVMCVLGPL